MGVQELTDSCRPGPRMVNQEKHRHIWTPIAPEETPGDSEHNGQIWYWCIRCGRLKLGEMIFSHGPHQKMSIEEDKP